MPSKVQGQDVHLDGSDVQVTGKTTPAQAQADLTELRAIITTWEARAKRLGLSAEDRLELEGCFLAGR